MGSTQAAAVYPDTSVSSIYPVQWGDTNISAVTQFTSVSDVEAVRRQYWNTGHSGALVFGIRHMMGPILPPCEKGVGHFTSTSAWNGNIGLCGHNRGSNYNIGSIKDLDIGDTIRYETSLGTRTYAVSSVEIIDWTDWSYLNGTTDNRITIITCLADQPTKRVCVQGVEVRS